MSLRAKKSLGQHFLVDAGVVDRILGEFGARADETIIEIGPGRGALTKKLIEAAGHVVGVEFDRQLIELLREEFGARENFTLVAADALEVDFCRLVDPVADARVVANLPYNISTAILQRLIAERACLTEMMLMLQREVVERITAAPGSSERGYLSVLVEAYCEAEALFDVAPSAFRPPPKVWSTIVRLRVRPQAAIDVPDEAVLWQIVSAGFAMRRKTIFNNLRNVGEELKARLERAGGAAMVLEGAVIDRERRAETLRLDEWARLARVLC